MVVGEDQKDHHVAFSLQHQQHRPIVMSLLLRTVLAIAVFGDVFSNDAK